MKKKRFLGILLSLTLVLGILPGVTVTAFAADDTIDFSAQGYADAEAISAAIAGTDCTVFFDQGSNSDHVPAYDAEGTAIRIYPDNTMTVSSENTITAIVIAFGTDDHENPITTDTGTYSEGVWTGSAQTVVFMIGGKEDCRSFRSIDVTYESKNPSVAVESISLSPNTAQNINVDEIAVFTAAVSPMDASDPAVIWGVTGDDPDAVKLYSNEECTEEVGDDPTETLTVYAKGIASGTAAVTAASSADAAISATCDVTVSAPVRSVNLRAAVVPVTKIEIVPDSGRALEPGGVMAFHAKITPENATDQEVYWEVPSGSLVIILYKDKECKTPLPPETAHKELTVYAKGIGLGLADIKVASHKDPDTIFSSFTVQVEKIPHLPAQKKLESTQTEGGKLICSWKMIFNPEAAVPAGDAEVTDEIAPEARPFMTYHGTGITVTKYKADGTQVGEPEVKNVGNMAEYKSYTWTYRIPYADQEPYKYVITYQTEVDLTKVNETGETQHLVNTANGTGAYVDVEPAEKLGISVSHGDYDETNKTVEWTGSISVPSCGLSKADAVISLPAKWINNQRMIDSFVNGSLSVDGLSEGESWVFDDSDVSDPENPNVKISFYKDSNQQAPGLRGTASGQVRNITVKCKTQVNQEWVDAETTEMGCSLHAASMKINNTSASDSVTIHTTHTHDGITFEPWTKSDSLPTTGTYYLTKDVILTEMTDMGSSVILCLNGHGIWMKGDAKQVIRSSGRYVILYDCNGSQSTHYITLTDYRGTAVSSTGTETAVDENGNGVVKVVGGYLTSSSTKAEWGGAIQVAGGTFIMEGGTIIGNHTVAGPGAVWADSGTRFDMSGGAIIYNKGAGNYGAVSPRNAIIRFSENPVISHNKSGSNQSGNVYLEGSSRISLANKLTNTVPIGISMDTPGRFTAYSTDRLKASDYKDHFSSDSSSYIVMVDDEELKLAIHTHFFSYQSGAGESANMITATCTPGCPDGYDTNGPTLKISAPTLKSYGQSGAGISPDAVITDPFNIRSLGNVNQYELDYYHAEEDGSGKTGDPLGDAPTDPGKYWAEFVLYFTDEHMNVGTSRIHAVYTIEKAALTNVSVTQNGTLTYTGSAQTPAVTTSATAKGNQTVTFAYSKTQDGTFGAMPTVTNVANSTTFYYKASAPNHEDATGSFTVTIEAKAVTVTAKDQNIYVGGTVPDLQGTDFFTVTGLVGEETLTTNPTLAYQKDGSAATPNSATAGTYDIVPSGASAGNNYSIGYTNGTLTISEKPAATVKKAPTAKTLTYTGSAQELVTAGEAEGGKMQYALGTATEATEQYTTSIPAKTEARTYYVWYKVAGDGNHNDTEAAKVLVTVGKATVTAPTIASKVYTGQTQTADVAASTLYSVTTNNGGTDVGNYDVVLTLTDSADYKWTDSEEAARTLTFRITKATANIVTVNIEGWIYGETAKAPTSTATFGTAVYTYAVKGSTQFDTKVPTNAGEYTVKAAVAGTANYPAGEATADFTIAKKVPVAGVDFTVEALQLTYTGSPQVLVRQTIHAEGLEIEYSFDYVAGVETGLPMKKASGEYLICYRVIGNEIYETLDWSDPMLATIRMYAAFSDPDFVLPPFLSEIGEEAFAEDTSITIVDAGGCAQVDACAFRNCTNLKRILLPQDCEIDDTAFDGCEALRMVFAPGGGTTAAWCAGHNVNFVPVSQN